MIIHKHKKCDICLNDIGISVECFTIKSKTFYKTFFESSGSNLITEKKKIDVCYDCMNEFKNWILRKEIENQDNLEYEVKKIMDKYGIDDLKGGIRIEH